MTQTFSLNFLSCVPLPFQQSPPHPQYIFDPFIPCSFSPNHYFSLLRTLWGSAFKLSQLNQGNDFLGAFLTLAMVSLLCEYESMDPSTEHNDSAKFLHLIYLLTSRTGFNIMG